jgi:hypothetical protein
MLKYLYLAFISCRVTWQLWYGWWQKHGSTGFDLKKKTNSYSVCLESKCLFHLSLIFWWQEKQSFWIIIQRERQSHTPTLHSFKQLQLALLMDKQKYNTIIFNINLLWLSHSIATKHTLDFFWLIILYISSIDIWQQKECKIIKCVDGFCYEVSI